VQALLIAAALLASDLAPPSDPPIDLEWTAPAQCPDRAFVLAETQALLGKVAPAAPGRRLTARGALLKDGELWRLHLVVDGGEGPAERDLADESCSRLAQAASLVLGLWLASPPVPAAAPPTRREEIPPRRFFARAVLGGDLGTLRAPSPGPGVAVGALLGRTRLEAVASYWFPQTAQGAEDRLWSTGIHSCTGLVTLPELEACAGVEGGRMEGRGFKGDASVVHAPWLGLVAGAALGWPIEEWLVLRVEILVGLTLVSPTFDLVDGTVRGPAPVFGRLATGLELRF